jgi:putative endonuclease
MYKVYILISDKYNRFYIGCTSDIQKRIVYHNSGKNKSTKPYRPWRILYVEDFENKTDAFKREWHLKHPKGYKEKCDIIRKHGGFA